MTLDSTSIPIGGRGQSPPPTKIVVCGNGDVSRRMVIPQSYSYHRTGQFNEKFAFVVVDFKPLTEAEFKKGCRIAVEQSSFGLSSETEWRRFEDCLFYIQGNFWGENAENRQEDYQRLATQIREIDARMGTQGNLIVYFGLPYFLYVEVTRQLSAVGLLEAQRELSVA